MSLKPAEDPRTMLAAKGKMGWRGWDGRKGTAASEALHLTNEDSILVIVTYQSCNILVLSAGVVCHEGGWAGAQSASARREPPLARDVP